LGGVGTLGVFACVQEMAVTLGDAPERLKAKHRKASVNWSGLPCEGRFWERKLGPAKLRYLLWFSDLGVPHI
jgi:hypothetical protein